MPRKTPHPSEPLVSHKEAAAYLGVPPQTLYWWNTRGIGPTRIRIGRAVKYRRSDLDHFIAAHEIPAGGH